MTVAWCFLCCFSSGFLRRLRLAVVAGGELVLEQFQQMLGHCQLEVVAVEVAQNEILFQQIDVREIVFVDYEAAAKANERRGAFGQSVDKDFLDARKAGVEHQDMAADVGQARVVAISLEEGHPVEIHDQELVARVDANFFHCIKILKIGTLRAKLMKISLSDKNIC